MMLERFKCFLSHHIWRRHVSQDETWDQCMSCGKRKHVGSGWGA